MSQNIPIVIGGPTASGKSQLAIDLAQELNGVIINADASQVYKSIPIISASPNAEDKQRVPHKLYEYLEDEVNGNVVMWLEEAVKAIREVWQQGKTPIIVGGGGLYLDNLINGTTPIPSVLPEIREQALKLVEEIGSEGLYKKLQLIDPLGSALVNPNDSTRVRRAYEIYMTTGISIAEWFKRPLIKKLPATEFFIIKLLPPKEELDKRCNLRFDIMMAEGGLREVEKLFKKNLSEQLPIMKAQGIPDLMAFLKGEIDFNQAIENAKLHTRQYAKRQLTWFRNKLKSNLTLNECYIGQTKIINDVKKQYKLLHK